MAVTKQDQAFLDEVYAKARLIAFDKMELEKVRRNQAQLARRRNRKLAWWSGMGACAILFLAYNDFNPLACLLLSFILATVGITVENAELSWNARRSGSSEQ